MSLRESGLLADDMDQPVAGPSRRKPSMPPPGPGDNIRAEILQLRRQVTGLEERMVLIQQNLQEMTTILRNIQAAGMRMHTHMKRDDNLDIM